MKGKKEIKTFLIRYIYSWKKKYANITFTMLCMVQPSLKYIYIFSRSRSNPLPLCLLFANGLFTRKRIISIRPVFLRNLLSEETTFLPSLLWENFLDVIIELEKLDLVSSERIDFVEKCLMNIDRVDLAKKVTAYKVSGETVFYFYFLILNGPNF